MGVLSEVRALTHSVHQSLDDHPLLVQFMSQAKVSAYQNFLQTFSLYLRLVTAKEHEFITSADQNVLQYEPWSIALMSDLEAYPKGDDFKFAERFSKLLPDIENLSEFWGLLYVMEGSTLGAKEVAGTLSEAWPSQFLRRGLQSRLRWPYFCRRIAELEMAGAIESRGVQQGAMKAFVSMISIFDSCLERPSNKSRAFISLSGDRQTVDDMS